jgi:xanthine dehydrogenase small subunit
MVAFFRPASLAEALAIRAEREVVILAGGTDIYPERTKRAAWGDPAHADLLDITAIPGLNRIDETRAAFRFGSLVTWTDLIHASLPPIFDAYRRAAREVGGIQVRNRGTLVGNLCTASPTCASIPNLLALEARVELTSTSGRREVPVAAFVDRSGHTLARPDEIVTAIVVPKHADAGSAFRKVGARRYLAIPIAVVSAIVATTTQNTLTDVRIAVGACSPVARRLNTLERELIGVHVAEAAMRLENRHFRVLDAIDDARASAAYRLAAAETLTRDVLVELALRSTRRAA